MFLGLEWQKWAIIIAVLVVVIPIKIRFLQWWNERQRDQKKDQRGKWGDEE